MSRIGNYIFHRRVLRRLRRVQMRAGREDLFALRKTRAQLRELRRSLDKVLHIADGRLTLPLVGSNAIQKPLHSDWAYRPELWRGPISPAGMTAVPSKTEIGDEIRLFHDCKTSELTLRQVRNTSERDLAPFGLRIDVFQFDGNFMSLVIELPKSARDGLSRRHLVRMTTFVDMEKPLEMFARFNFKHGPNSEQIIRELTVEDGCAVVEFDLAYTNLNEKRLERAWIDLIFEGPQMNQIMLRDITFSRRPRAEM